MPGAAAELARSSVGSTDAAEGVELGGLVDANLIEPNVVAARRVRVQQR